MQTDFQIILEKLEGLSADARRKELLKPWPQMSHDMGIVYEEFVSELRMAGTVPAFLKSYKIEGGKVTFEMPDWWYQSQKCFFELYGYPENAVRFQKAVAVFSEQIATRQSKTVEELERMLI